MTIADERILEFLRDNAPRQPKQLTEELKERGMTYNDKYIGRRCLELSRHGLLRNLGNGIYSITDHGRDYLDGELAAFDLEVEEA